MELQTQICIHEGYDLNNEGKLRIHNWIYSLLQSINVTKLEREQSLDQGLNIKKELHKII